MKPFHTFLSSSLISSSLISSLLLAGVLSLPVQAETARQPAKEPVATAQAATPATATVNINTADAATMAERLNGVGQKKAEAIVSYREQHGPFKTVDELVDVAGIGEATLEKNRAMISVN